MLTDREISAFAMGAVTTFVLIIFALLATVTPEEGLDLCDSLYGYAESASDVLAIHREHPYCKIPEVTPTARSYDLRSPRHADWRQSSEVTP